MSHGIGTSDQENPRPLLIHTGNLTHSIRNAEVTWNGDLDFTIAVEERPYPKKDVTTRDVFLFHQRITVPKNVKHVRSQMEIYKYLKKNNET